MFTAFRLAWCDPVQVLHFQPQAALKGQELRHIDFSLHRKRRQADAAQAGHGFGDGAHIRRGCWFRF